ncbi:MAG TPA: hypothetical protein VLM75_01985 [Spirochaetota bacterium]|nr:hypothetical protein [Spirochaetota bacterium]
MHDRIDISNLIIAVIFSALAIAVPVIFHAIGLGSMFMPMYLPLAIGAFLMTRVNAAMAGFFTPLISALVTGMPPFYPPVAFVMMLQLAVFCFTISLMTHRFKFGVIVSLAVAVLLDRFLLMALFYLVYPLFSIDSRIITLYDLLKSLPGIALLFIVVPLAVLRCGAILRKNSLHLFEHRHGENHEH